MGLRDQNEPYTLFCSATVFYRQRRFYDMIEINDRVSHEVRRLMDGGHNCAEAIILAAGKEVIDDFDPSICRMATGFGGGFGSTHKEICGALSGGAMVIGALHGRTNPKADKYRCYTLMADYRQRFIDRFGSSCCGDLYQGPIACTQIVQEAALMLLEVLDGGEKDGHAEG
jgi:C_GCAxxG_C_C family probable redox protein